MVNKDSDGREKPDALAWAVTIIPMFSAGTSLICSIFLLRHIILKSGRNICRWHQENAREFSVRDQLIIGLSVFDACSSFGFVFSTIWAPRGVSSYPTFGTVQTCNAQGFFVQLGTIGVPLYNAALCISFLLAIRWRWRDSSYHWAALPLMHFAISSIALGCSVYGVVKELFNSAGALGCFVSEVDEDACSIDPRTCGRGENAHSLLYVNVVVVATSFVVVVCSMILLYYSLRSVEMARRRWDPAPGLQPSTELTVNTDRVVRRRSSWSQSLTQPALETGILYSVSFCLCYLPPSILNFFPLPPVGYDTVLVITVLFLPLQGFFNLLIYRLPDWRPHVSFWTQQLVRSLARCRHKCAENFVRRKGNSASEEVVDDTGEDASHSGHRSEDGVEMTDEETQ